MKTGRPKIKGGRKTATVAMLTPKERQLCERAAALARLSVSSWLATLIRDHFMSEAREKVG